MAEVVMLSTNIKIARMAVGLSLQELSDRLKENGYPTTKATLSNYENGIYVPSNDILKEISKELNTSMEFLLDNTITECDLRFFQKADMIDRVQQSLEAFITKELSRFIHIDNILGYKAEWTYTKKTLYRTDDTAAIENLAYRVRTEHGAGSHTIASVCDMLERKGWHIFALPDYCRNNRTISGYDCISGTPFILYKPDEYQDEMRLSLLRSVGYSLIEGETREDTDALVAHFARAVLIPENLVRYTFGNNRNTITETELATAKKMYGIGKKYLMRRMWELEIISDDLFSDYMTYISQRYDLVRSSGLTDDSRFYDVPTSYEMRVARAHAEGLTTITSAKSSYSDKDGNSES